MRDLVALRQRFGAHGRDLALQRRARPSLASLSSTSFCDFAGIAIGRDGGGRGALRQPIGRRAAPPGCCSRLRRRAAAARRRSATAATAGRSARGRPCRARRSAPGRITMRSTRPCVAAGISRRASSTGTSVPRPRTWRSIGPRLTVSTQTVARSTVGAAGLRRARTTETRPMTRTPAMANKMRRSFFWRATDAGR